MTRTTIFRVLGTMLCRLVVEQAGGYLRRIRREPSHALRTLLKGVLHAMRIAQYRNP